MRALPVIRTDATPGRPMDVRMPGREPLPGPANRRTR